MKHLSWLNHIFSVLGLLLAVFLFLLGIELMIVTLEAEGEASVQLIFSMIHNPFVALFVGILATALVQSSSMITSITVALTATSVLSYSQAVPVVIGANIGTTLTCFLVTLGHVMRKREFRYAVSGSALHILFNLVTALLLFPLEYQFRLLSGSAHWLAVFMKDLSVPVPHQGLKHWLIHPTAVWLREWLSGSFWLSLWLSFGLMIGFVRLLAFMFKSLLQRQVMYVLGRHIQSWLAVLLGALLTILVQSSSLTTSLIVMAAALNRVRFLLAFNLIIGANVGTTLTALLAALGNGEAALTIALTHVLFNLTGLLLFAPWKKVKLWLIDRVELLGYLHVRHRLLGFIAILLLFFVIPFLLIYASRQRTVHTSGYHIQTLEQRSFSDAD